MKGQNVKYWMVIFVSRLQTLFQSQPNIDILCPIFSLKENDVTINEFMVHELFPLFKTAAIC